jgi:hypothetical protein
VVEPAELQQLLDYWHRMRGDRAMPLRSDLAPHEIPALLPYLMLLDVEPSPLRFRYRLAGSNTYDIREGLGARSVTGHYATRCGSILRPPTRSSRSCGSA